MEFVSAHLSDAHPELPVWIIDCQIDSKKFKALGD